MTNTGRLRLSPQIPNPKSEIPSPPMDAQIAIDLGRQAVWTALLVAAPVLLAGMAVGLMVGLFQALTQIQEQTVAFVPKIVAMVLTLTFALPWLISRMLQYSTDLIQGIPGRF